MKSLKGWGLLLVLLGCSRPDNSPLGVVQDCDNGLYFSLKTQTCQALWGHTAEVDADGYSRMRLWNGITVPRKINGKTPFAVSIAYDVSRASTIEVVMKKVEFGGVGGDAFTEWQKFDVPVGTGVRTLVLNPNQIIPKGTAAAYTDGHWTVDSGYVLEVKGGDRFEDEDADIYASWRIAGIQVDPESADDPLGKDIIFGELTELAEIRSCELLTFDLPIKRLSYRATFDLALKQPRNGWNGFGGEKIQVDSGFEGTLNFRFVTKNDEERCAPPGAAARADASGEIPEDSYVLQLDVYDDDGNKRVQNSWPIRVVAGN